jgi:pimeloyl-ACP methyl ester carboxylesterase
MIQMERLKPRYVTVDHFNVRYLDNARRRAQTLLFVHGLGGSIESWKKNIEPLSGIFRILVLDLPGFGLSDKPLMDYTIGFYSSLVMKFIRELKVKPPINIVGSSLGGQIAADIAILNPQIVRKLILISPAGVTPKSFVNSPGLHAYTNILKATSIARIKKLISMSGTVPVSNAYATMILQRISMPGAKEAFTSALKHSADARRIDTKRIKSHTLVIWGKEDLVIPVKFVSPFITMKNCRVNIIENCGHRPQAEKPVILNAIIQNFIQEKGVSHFYK